MITPVSKAVIKYWLLRMRFLRHLRLQVQGTIDLNIQSECLFCRYRYGLQVELMQSLEDMFFDYLELVGATVANYDYIKWIRHFKKEARYRTTCISCTEKIEMVHNFNLK